MLKNAVIAELRAQGTPQQQQLNSVESMEYLATIMRKNDELEREIRHLKGDVARLEEFKKNTREGVETRRGVTREDDLRMQANDKLKDDRVIIFIHIIIIIRSALIILFLLADCALCMV
jgi:uncharacterized protein with von Willebrand factor type A (vWA) domain